MNRSLLHVLVVDDDAAIRRSLRTSLSEHGFQVAEAARGEEAFHLVRATNFDAVLLDIQMPGLGGIKTLVQLRQIAPRTPVIMVTVKDSEEQKVEALECGADDYITKPFGIRECMARIRAVVRRSSTLEVPQDEPLQIGEIIVEPVIRKMSKTGNPLHLTRREYEILHYLMRNAGRVITHGKLLGAVWGPEYRDEVDYLRTLFGSFERRSKTTLPIQSTC